jgi:polysaccharide export outer membrane protein
MNLKCKLNQATLFLIFSALAALTSCRSHKELMYLRDADGQQTIAGMPKAMPMYKIKKKDNLYVNIISSNTELNKTFNPTQAGNTSETNKFETAAAQFVNGYEVDVNGNVNLPIIGKVNVEGKTLSDAQKAVETKTLTFLKDAVVKVKLLNYRVTVLGEVKTPGVYNNYNYNLTVLDAIGMASGTTNDSDLTNVMVLRPTTDGSQSYTMNLNTKVALGSEGFYLQPNDVVFIQPSKSKFAQVGTSTAAVVLTSISSVLLLLNYIKK